MSMVLPTLTRPSRAASLRSTGTASSRLPSTMSALAIVSGSLATIFSLRRRRRSGSSATAGTGSRVTGSGAPTASGLKKSRGLRMARNRTRTGLAVAPRRRRGARGASRDEERHGPPASVDRCGSCDRAVEDDRAVVEVVVHDALGRLLRPRCAGCVSDRRPRARAARVAAGVLGCLDRLRVMRTVGLDDQRMVRPVEVDACATRRASSSIGCCERRPLRCRRRGTGAGRRARAGCRPARRRGARARGSAAGCARRAGVDAAPGRRRSP